MQRSLDANVAQILQGALTPLKDKFTHEENGITVSLLSESEVEAEFKRINALVNRPMGAKFATHLMYLYSIEVNLRQVSFHICFLFYVLDYY